MMGWPIPDRLVTTTSERSSLASVQRLELLCSYMSYLERELTDDDQELLARAVVRLRYEPLYGAVDAGECSMHGREVLAPGVASPINTLIMIHEMKDVDELVAAVREWQGKMRREYREAETRLLLADYLEEVVSYVVGPNQAHIVLHCMGR